MRLDQHHFLSFLVHLWAAVSLFSILGWYSLHYDVGGHSRHALTLNASQIRDGSLQLFDSFRSPCRLNKDGSLPNARCIRLVKICPPPPSTKFPFVLRWKVFELAKAPPYRALSYTCGLAKGIPEDTEPQFHFGDNNELNRMPKKLPSCPVADSWPR